MKLNRRSILFASAATTLDTTAENQAFPNLSQNLAAVYADPQAQQHSGRAEFRERVNVKQFNAVGDGIADDTAAIQAAANFCAATGLFLMGIPGTYRITSTLILNCSGDLSAMKLNTNATAVPTAIRVGSNVAGQYLFDVALVLPFLMNTAKTSTGWTGFDNSVGIEIANVYQSRITVPSVYKFGIGLKCGGYGVGCAYNTITIGVLFDNKINHQVKPGDASGWSNQNIYIGGRFGFSSAEGVAVNGVKHIELRDFDTTGPNAPNNNLWLNPCVEGDEPMFHIDIQGTSNTFLNPRFEVLGRMSARVNFHAMTANETTGNTFYSGYKFGMLYSFSGTGTSNNNNYLGARGQNVIDCSGVAYNVKNSSGSSISAPHFQGFAASAQPLQKSELSTDWTYRIFGEGYAAKKATDTHPRLQLDASGYVLFGGGTAALVGGFRYNGTPAAITCSIPFSPDSDNNVTLGTANRRWSVLYAGTGTINTSDGRDKQDIAPLDEAERRVALALKLLIKKFRFKDAVSSKGDAARIHVGVIAQDVLSAFKSEGLDANRYGILCYDECKAEMDVIGLERPPACNRYGVRYEELLAFVIAAM